MNSLRKAVNSIQLYVICYELQRRKQVYVYFKWEKNNEDKKKEDGLLLMTLYQPAAPIPAALSRHVTLQK